jgi:hypothetical protein
MRTSPHGNLSHDNSPLENPPHGNLLHDNSPHGLLALWTSRPLDNLAHDKFTAWAINSGKNHSIKLLLKKEKCAMCAV